ncbi:RHS repeat-associated core domain-containing protein [Lysobacter sp. CA199]|uniref:RHS repeat-associated core domain-containing protein n=1 Tax=Lysobacter sp. CA199 TaxID=3455608 RepID=UPI003F8D5662
MKWISKFVAAASLAIAGFAAQAQTVVEYIHTDALGSPVAVTDADQNVIERTEYEPYGAQITRPVQDGPGYTGHVGDAATGLSYMQQRYFDPQIGRFLSVDPVTASSGTGANFNRYKYANNNPYRFIDPDGRYACQATKTQCLQFDRGMTLINKALANSKGNAKTLLAGIVKTLGTRDDGNGVN